MKNGTKRALDENRKFLNPFGPSDTHSGCYDVPRWCSNL